LNKTSVADHAVIHEVACGKPVCSNEYHGRVSLVSDQWLRINYRTIAQIDASI